MPSWKSITSRKGVSLPVAGVYDRRQKSLSKELWGGRTACLLVNDEWQPERSPYHLQSEHQAPLRRHDLRGIAPIAYFAAKLIYRACRTPYRPCAQSYRPCAPTKPSRAFRHRTCATCYRRCQRGHRTSALLYRACQFVHRPCEPIYRVRDFPHRPCAFANRRSEFRYRAC